MDHERSIGRRRELWLDARGLGARVGSFLEAAVTSGVTTILLSPDQLPMVPESAPIEIAVRLNSHDAMPACDRAAIAVIDAEGADRDIGFAGRRALYGSIASEDDLRRFADVLASGGGAYGIVELHAETNIPLELLVARLQALPIRLLKRVRSAAEGRIALETLEWGAAGFLLATDDPSEVAAAAGAIRAARQDIVCTEWEVTRVTHVGAGHRVCVDTVALLSRTEGMLVGSQCNALVVMCSETHPLPYMPLRPFRVNAGALHSYILAPGNQTHYLSELEAGAECLVIDTTGRTRPVTVGRAKIECRPLLLIAFTGEGTEGTVFVQDDWHVRVMGAQGEALNVTSCKPGTRLLGWRAAGARHCGIPFDEQLLER